jgi:hypothetical protein
MMLAALSIAFGYLALLWYFGWAGLAACALHVFILWAACRSPKRRRERHAILPTSFDTTEPQGPP